MKTIKSMAAKTSACRHGLGRLGALLLLAGCSALPVSPKRPVLYDFGPGNVTRATTDQYAPLPPLALAAVEMRGLPEGSSAVLYRLAYTDARELHPYSHARWSQPPAQLLQQRLREQIGLRRAVLDADDGAVQARNGKPPLLLRVELEEFSHLFVSPTQSAGVVRLRATLSERTLAGELLRGQQVFIVQKAAHSADVGGGVAALAEAATQLSSELAGWVEQVERDGSVR